MVIGLSTPYCDKHHQHGDEWDREDKNIYFVVHNITSFLSMKFTNFPRYYPSLREIGLHRYKPDFSSGSLPKLAIQLPDKEFR